MCVRHGPFPETSAGAIAISEAQPAKQTEGT
jgi:hypothetical protein